jgi:hypothetical protein
MGTDLLWTGSFGWSSPRVVVPSGSTAHEEKKLITSPPAKSSPVVKKIIFSPKNTSKTDETPLHVVFSPKNLRKIDRTQAALRRYVDLVNYGVPGPKDENDEKAVVVPINVVVVDPAGLSNIRLESMEGAAGASGELYTQWLKPGQRNRIFPSKVAENITAAGQAVYHEYRADHNVIHVVGPTFATVRGVLEDDARTLAVAYTAVWRAFLGARADKPSLTALRTPPISGGIFAEGWKIPKIKEGESIDWDQETRTKKAGLCDLTMRALQISFTHLDTEEQKEFDRLANVKPFIHLCIFKVYEQPLFKHAFTKACETLQSVEE